MPLVGGRLCTRIRQRTSKSRDLGSFHGLDQVDRVGRELLG